MIGGYEALDFFHSGVICPTCGFWLVYGFAFKILPLIQQRFLEVSYFMQFLVCSFVSLWFLTWKESYNGLGKAALLEHKKYVSF